MLQLKKILMQYIYVTLCPQGLVQYLAHGGYDILASILC